MTAILQAASQALATHGYARTTTNLVAARAGVSVGSLYQYFPNKDALLAALHQLHAARVTEVLSHSLSRLADPSVPLPLGLRRMLEELQALHDEDPALTRALAEHSPQVPPLEATARHDEGAFTARVEALLGARPDVRAGDRGLMALVVTRAANAMTRWLAHDRPPAIERRAAVDEVTRLLAGYLIS